jgi:hypothetical protein
MKKWEKLASGLVSCNGCHYGTRGFSTAFTRVATCPNPEPVQSVQAPHSAFWRSNLVLNLPSTPGSSKCSLSLRFLHQNPVWGALSVISATIMSSVRQERGVEWMLCLSLAYSYCWERHICGCPSERTAYCVWLWTAPRRRARPTFWDSLLQEVTSLTPRNVVAVRNHEQ